jgi:N-acetylglucosaminyl-diphospho-decaprenol L-rhamnosyltransferase
VVRAEISRPNHINNNTQLQHSPESLHSLTVIIVTYNSAHCIAGLEPLLMNCPNIIISDNASSDNTIYKFKQQIPHAKILAQPKNIGFGAANNRALNQVKTPFALLLNPDCIFQTEELKNLLHAAQQFPSAAIMAPQLINAKGIPVVNYRWPNTIWKSNGPEASGPICVGFVCGAAMLFRISAFEETGFFDEDFFLYYEDDDLCLRLFEKQSELIIFPNIVAIHINRGSVKGGQPLINEYHRGYHHAQSKLIFENKHKGLLYALHKRNRLIWLTILAIPFRTLAFSPRLIARMAGRLFGVLHWLKNK